MKKYAFVLAICLCTMASLWAQKTVSGKVTDEGGNPLVGVVVRVPNTPLGTITDGSGVFRLELPVDQNILEISYLGFETKTVTIDQTEQVDVILNVDNLTLNEVVVLGYGTQQKRAITGNISRVRSEAIADLPAQSFDQLIQGKAAGVNVNLPNGVLNNPPVFRIRVSTLFLSAHTH